VLFDQRADGGYPRQSIIFLVPVFGFWRCRRISHVHLRVIGDRLRASAALGLGRMHSTRRCSGRKIASRRRLRRIAPRRVIGARPVASIFPATHIAPLVRSTAGAHRMRDQSR
jgi:hypothetical protein